MSSTAMSAALPARGAWRAPAVVLGVVLVAWGLAFHAEATAALTVWSESSAFGHCFLIAPIAAWLAWERRGRLAELTPHPTPTAALLMLPLGLVWLAAEQLAIMELRQFAALGMAWTLVLAVFGRQTVRAFAVPLAYTVFLVPFGAFLVPALQDFTAHFIDAGLEWFDVPHVVTDTYIEIPEGAFQVAEACAGLRFLIAAIAFGTLYACVIYRSPWRRLGFVAVSVVVPVLANGLRALGIVLLGHALGSAEAGAVDHVLYGWIFFSVVIFLLLLLGLPFRQDGVRLQPPADAARPVAWQPRRLALAGVVAVLLAVAGPAAAWQLSRAEAGEGARGNVAATRFTGGDVHLDVRVQTFGASAGTEILAVLHAATAASDVAARSVVTQGRVRWQVVATQDPAVMVAAALWLNGAPAPDGLALRLALARNSLTHLGVWPGGAVPGPPPVLVTVVATRAAEGKAPASSATSHPLADRLTAFLQSYGEPAS